MGIQISTDIQVQPAVEPFLSWDADMVDSWVSFMRTCTGNSIRMSKWNMLEFVGTERLHEVSDLFKVFEEEPDSSAIHGLQLAVALLLCNRKMTLETKLFCCISLFDWTSSGCLSMPDLAFLLEACAAAIGHCIQSPVASDPGSASIRDLCGQAIPNGSTATHEELVHWAMNNELARSVLQCFAADADAEFISEATAPKTGGAEAEPLTDDAELHALGDDKEMPAAPEHDQSTDDAAAVGEQSQVAASAADEEAALPPDDSGAHPQADKGDAAEEDTASA